MENRKVVLEFIENSKAEYLALSHHIHANPEIGNEEYKSSQLLIEKLEKNGFSIERNIAGYETGFIATYSSGKSGATIGYLAEYDALPGLGHACGHNIIGTQSVLAGIALKQIIDEIGGTVKVFGTPAEEGGINGSAKAGYAKENIFAGVDVAMMIHPGRDSFLTLTTLAVDVFEVEYFGKAAHAAANPEDGINALDAMLQFYNGINALRQQMKNKDMVHGVIVNGGDAPNIIPDYTKARFFTRSLRRKDLDVLTKKVQNIAEGAALQTGTTLKFNFIQNGVDDFYINNPFDEVYREIATELGDNIVEETSGSYGSTDAGNVSQVIPTIHPHIKIGSSDLVAHTIEFREAAKSEMGDNALILGAKTLALVGKELIENKEKLQEIKDYFEQK